MRSKSFLRASGAGGTLAGLAALVLLLSCDDTIGPDPRIDAGDRVPAISDAAHGDLGNPYFFWLAPMVDQPSSAEFGTFDPNAAPELRVLCDYTSGSAPDCPIDPTIAVFTAGTTPGIVIVDEHYQLDFDTQGSFGGYELQATTSDAVTVYRFQVVLNGTDGEVVAGYADFQLGATGKDVKHLSEDTTTIALKDGRTLPVRFRVETLAYAFATLVDEGDCVDGCSFTELDGASLEPQKMAYYDEDTGYETTAALFEPGDLPPGDYLAKIEKKITDKEDATRTSTCAYDVDLEKWDCYEYSIYPDVAFNNPVRLGICAVSFPEARTPRMAKVDRDADGNPILLWPDPADVSGFLSCDPTVASSTGTVGSALQYAFDWFVPPLYAQTTVRTIGGMTNDFSDFFLTPEDGLVSHWTADQLEPDAYADAMGINDGEPNSAVQIAEDAGAWANAFQFFPVGGSDEFATPGGAIIATATDVAELQRLSLSAWVRIDPEGDPDRIQRFITIQGEKSAIRMDGENARGQLHFYLRFDDGQDRYVQRDVRVSGVMGPCYQHVVGTYDGVTLRVYLDGTEVGSTSATGTLLPGTGIELGSGTEPLDGLLDEARIYHRALSATEVQALFDVRRNGLNVGCEPFPQPVVTVDITGDDTQVPVGYSTQLSATATQGADPLSGATFQWSSSNTSVATVDAAGLVTAHAAGQATITAATTVGGASYSGDFALSMYAPVGAWTAAGSLATARAGAVAIYLETGEQAGKVLVLGGDAVSAELYDPGSEMSSTITSNGPLYPHGRGMTATRLSDGTYLLAGGVGAPGYAEIFDPVSMTFTETTGVLVEARAFASATLLEDGRVLIAGGEDQTTSYTTAGAEIYDPTTGTFTATGSMSTDRTGHGAARLGNGTVLVAGGSQSTGINTGIWLSSAEVWSPTTGTFSPTGSMTEVGAPGEFGAHTLSSGNILMLASAGYTVGAAQLYDPAGGVFNQPDEFWTGRGAGSSVALLDGRVLFAGGVQYGPTTRDEVELFDPDTGRFVVAASMNQERQEAAAVLLPSGEVLVLGGYSHDTGSRLSSVERFNPGN